MIKDFYKKSFIIKSSVLFLWMVVNSASAQWLQTNGPGGGNVACMAMSGSNIFAGTFGGVYYSANNGITWNLANNGLTNTDVRALVSDGTTTYAGGCLLHVRPLADSEEIAGAA